MKKINKNETVPIIDFVYIKAFSCWFFLHLKYIESLNFIKEMYYCKPGMLILFDLLFIYFGILCKGM